jgi:hypothetical protein
VSGPHRARFVRPSRARRRRRGCRHLQQHLADTWRGLAETCRLRSVPNEFEALGAALGSSLRVRHRPSTVPGPEADLGMNLANHRVASVRAHQRIDLADLRVDHPRLLADLLPGCRVAGVASLLVGFRRERRAEWCREDAARSNPESFSGEYVALARVAIGQADRDVDRDDLRADMLVEEIDRVGVDLRPDRTTVDIACDGKPAGRAAVDAGDEPHGRNCRSWLGRWEGRT